MPKLQADKSLGKRNGVVLPQPEYITPASRPSGVSGADGNGVNYALAKAKDAKDEANAFLTFENKFARIVCAAVFRADDTSARIA